MLGALLVGAGTLLTASPDPLFGQASTTLLPAAASVLGLIAVVWGREWLALVALATGLAATIPPPLPMDWIPAVLAALGAVLLFEGARARREATPPPPLKAFLLPALLLLASLLVALAALTTQSGRESLDLAQGLGVAVSAPFLLLAAWGILTLIHQRRSTPTSAITVTVLAVLVALALVPLTPPAEAQPGQQQGERTTVMSIERVVVVDDTGAGGREIDGFSYEIREDQIAFLKPFFLPSYTNATFSQATLQLKGFTFSDTFTKQCDREFTLRASRVLQPWGTTTTWETLPNTTDPHTTTYTREDCASNIPLNFDVTEHYRDWGDGAPWQGWLVELVSVDGTPVSSTRGEPTLQVERGESFSITTWNPNAPRIRHVDTDPGTVEGTLFGPVGGNVTLDVNITDRRGGMRSVVVSQEDTELARASLTDAFNGTRDVQLTLPIEASTPTGPLDLFVVDWDGNNATLDGFVELELDPEPPSIQVIDAPPEEADEDQVIHTRLNITDDGCQRVEACITWNVTTGDGVVLASNTTEQNVSIPLPTDRPGRHEVHIVAEDVAGAISRELLVYNIREPRAPVLEDLEINGFRGAPIQEAGLPVHVDLSATDETPPLTVRVLDGEMELAAHESLEAAFNLTVPGLEAGNHTLTVEVTDHWGNQATETANLTVERAQEPRIRLPGASVVGSTAQLTITVEDRSVRPSNVTITATQDGQRLADLRERVTLLERGLHISVDLPSLLHGEQATLSVTAVDDLGQGASASQELTADLRGPRIEITSDQGVRNATAILARSTANLTFTATDDVSEVTAFDLVLPRRLSLDPVGETLPARELGSGPVHAQATDGVGNQANRTLELVLDDEAPELLLDIQGHEVLVTAREELSGLDTLTFSVDGTTLPVPLASSTHRVALDNVVRGDRIVASLTAQDRVGNEAALTERLTVQDAEPTITVGQRDGDTLPITVDDPDNDALDTTITVRHRVTERETTVPIEDGAIQLPDWRGELLVHIRAEAHGKTVTHETVLLRGQGPFLHAKADGDRDTGEPVEINVTWERAASKLTAVATRDGAEVASAPIEVQRPGQGTATFTFEEAGDYELTVRMVTEDGEVEIAQAGTVDIDDPIGWIPLLLIMLVLIGVAGWVLQAVLARDADASASPDGDER